MITIAVFPKLNAGQIWQKCGYYAGTFSFKMRVLCGYYKPKMRVYY